MKKIYLFVLTIFMSVYSMAQKVELDKNVITADGKYYATLEKQGCKFLEVDCQYLVKDKNGKSQIVIKFAEENDPDEVKPSNSTGRVIWADIIFLESKKKGQWGYFFTKEKKMAAQLVKWDLFKDGMLDSAKVEKFILVNPVERPKKATRIIVETREAPPARRNGVQISF